MGTVLGRRPPTPISLYELQKCPQNRPPNSPPDRAPGCQGDPRCGLELDCLLPAILRCEKSPRSPPHPTSVFTAPHEGPPEESPLRIPPPRIPQGDPPWRIRHWDPPRRIPFGGSSRGISSRGSLRGTPLGGSPTRGIATSPSLDHELRSRLTSAHLFPTLSPAVNR